MYGPRPPVREHRVRDGQQTAPRGDEPPERGEFGRRERMGRRAEDQGRDEAELRVVEGTGDLQERRPGRRSGPRAAPLRVQES